MQPVSAHSMPTYIGNDGQPFPLGTLGSVSGSAVAAVPLNTTGVMVVDRYRHKHSILLGITQVFLGLACIIFNSVALGILEKTGDFGLSVVGYGFWIGLTFISAGGLGIAAGKNRTKCTIIAFMVMCIISAALTTVVLSLGIAGAVITSHDGGRRCYYRTSSYGPDCSDNRAVAAMEACLAVAGVIEAIAAIWGAVICCQSGMCCCSGPQPAVMPSVSYYPNGQVMLVTYPYGVQMIYPQPQVAAPFPQDRPNCLEISQVEPLIGSPKETETDYTLLTELQHRTPAAIYERLNK